MWLRDDPVNVFPASQRRVGEKGAFIDYSHVRGLSLVQLVVFGIQSEVAVIMHLFSC